MLGMSFLSRNYFVLHALCVSHKQVMSIWTEARQFQAGGIGSMSTYLSELPPPPIVPYACGLAEDQF